MKIYSYILVALFSLCHFAHSSVIFTQVSFPDSPSPPLPENIVINEGDHLLWSFSPSDFTGKEPWWIANRTYTHWKIRLSNIASNNIFRISLFEDSSQESPFSDVTFTNFPSVGGSIWANTDFWDATWTDKQGEIKIEAIKGDLGLYSASAHTILNGERLTTSIPEPNTVVLLMVGTEIIYLRRKRFSNQRVELTRKTLADWDIE